MDREQKLFLEASDWEAKFYQIQSKYLLLLNELHNPQVMVSASRQQMVGHLLKDIVESSEKPVLTSENTEHDRLNACKIFFNTVKYFSGSGSGSTTAPRCWSGRSGCSGSRRRTWPSPSSRWRRRRPGGSN